jgi:hypothetical protein
VTERRAPGLRRAALILLALAPTAARAEPSGEGGLPQKAFMLQMQLGGSQAIPLYSTQGALQVAGFSVMPALVIGARLANRVDFGVGLSFVRFSTDTTALNVLTFAPTVAVDVVKAKDNKVDLYLKLGLPLGPVIVTQGPVTDKGFGVGFQLGVGARYALHPMFAIGMEGGATGQFVNPQRGTQGNGFANFYGALTGTFFYGSRAK